MSIYDNAGVALIPSGTKASKLYSVLPANGDGDFTHDRNLTTATRVNKDGFIEGVAADVPRLDYPLIDGVVQDCPALLLEPSRTNSLQRTEEFDNSTWNKGSLTVTANQAISPDGSQTADKITPSATTGAIRIWQTQTTSAATYSLSFFVKYNGKQYVQLLFGSLLNSSAYSNFDLINGSVTSGTGKIENYGSGWYRISLTASLNASTDQVYLWSIDSETASRGASSTGNGSDGYYVWGSQLEQGSYPTSYISWDGSGSTTRSADVCNGSGTSAEFNDSEGVLFAEIFIEENIESNVNISISTGVHQESLLKFIYVVSENAFKGELFNASQTLTFITYANYDLGVFNKVLLSYNSSNLKLYINGFEINSVSVNGLPSGLNQLNFDRADGSADFYGKTKQLMTFKTALTDSDLETLTSWDSFNAMATGQQYTIE